MPSRVRRYAGLVPLPLPMLFAAPIVLGALGCDVVPAPHADDAWPPLPPAPAADDPRAVHHAQAAALRGRLTAGAVDVDTVVWFARRLGYLGDFEGSIAACTEGLERFPDDPHLLRHRGHRCLSTRRYGAAVDDLARARAVMGGAADAIEPDGLPNAAGRPTGTLGTAVLYHLALAQYLRGEFPAAIEAWAACAARAPSRDMEVAARSWLVLSLRRSGDTSGARAAAAMVAADWEILENADYHRLCLLESGQVDAGGLLVAAATPGASEALRYGAARYVLDHGGSDGAQRLALLVADGAPAAFGTLAAAADLAALEGSR